MEEIQTINPNETLSHLTASYISSHKDAYKRLFNDLRQAGLPE